mgnify:CR=1 FL=1
MYKLINFQEANDGKHKFISSVLNTTTGKIKNIKFGSYGMSDYTQHKNDAMKMNYINRHKARENWNNPLSAGFWSRWILWNKKDLNDSLIYTINRFYL